MLKNMLPRLDVEKNKLTLAAAEGTIEQLRRTLAFKHAAADLDIQILQVAAINSTSSLAMPNRMHN